MHEGKKCKIRNFGDPHLFFVLYDEHEAALRNLEAVLEEGFVDNVEPVPKKDQIYIIKHEGQLKRAVALTKSHSFYCCWLVDYGELAWEKVFYSLPSSCDMKPLSIKAGLNKTVALDSYVSETGLIEFKTSTKFSTGASHSIRNQIKAAKEVYFKEERMIRNVYFGQVYLRLDDVEWINLITSMQKINIIAVDEDLFDQALAKTMDVESNKKYSNEEGTRVGRGYSRNNRQSLPKTTSSQEQVQDWLSSTMHEILILSDSCSPAIQEDGDVAKQNLDRESPSKNIIKHVKEVKEEPKTPSKNITDQKKDEDVVKEEPKKSGMMRKDQKKDNGVVKEEPKKGGMMRKLQEKMMGGNRNESDAESSPGKITPTDIIAECRSSNSSIISTIRKMKSQSVLSSSEASVKASSTDSDAGNSHKKTSSEAGEDSDSNVYKNEKSIVKKFRCDCADCRHWDDNDFDTRQEEFRLRRVKPVVRPDLLLKSGDEVAAAPLLKSSKEFNEFPLGRKMSSPNILVHGTIIPFPQKYLADIPFIKPIHTSLRSLNHEKCLSVQQYGWPAIMRNMNLCVVGTANSGKTTTYVPAICSLLMEADRYHDLPRENGPIALVLCAESRDVEKVHRRFWDVCANTKPNVKLRVVQAVAPLNPSIMSNFKSACDILITTPAVLIALLSKNTFNLKRLCHLVVEDIDEIYRMTNKPLPSILNVVQDMLGHRVCAKQVQFICTAEHWTFDVENLMKRLNSVPLIIIGHPIESALYGRADILVREVPSNAKQSILYDNIKDHYRVYKTVIVCNKDEIKPLQELFQLYGIGILIADESMPGEDISDIHKSWSSRSGGDHMVLICTDFVLRTQMNITDCSILVNYSLPANWSLFRRRWSCLIDNYKSPLNTNQDTFNCKIFVFIDEQSGKEITRIINYLQAAGLKLRPNIIEYSQKYKETTEIQKIQNKIPLCPTWKRTTACDSVTCKYRHVLNRELDTNNLNISGRLTFDVDHVQDINSFKIQPAQFETGRGDVHRFHNTKPEVDRLLKEMKMKEFVVNIKVDEMYILEEEDKSLIRCVVKKIVDYHSITKTPSAVVVEGVDSGFHHRRVSTSILFEVPDNLRKIPSSLMDLIIVNIVPLNNEKYWSDRARRLLNSTLEENKSANVYCSGNVALVLGRTVWMENFQMHTQLAYLKQVVTCFTLLPYLTQQHFVKIEKSQLAKWIEECEKFNVPVPEYEMMKAEIKTVLRQPKPQWAFLPKFDLFNAVTFSSGVTPRKFFVKLQKFSDIYTNFNNSIQELVKQRSLQLKSNEITVGNCYLAPDPEIDHVYSRVIVTEIRDEDTADCFYVDYGDVAYIPLKKIKFLPNDYITKLPFQCIECGLHGVSPVVDDWSDDALDILYKYCFENDSHYYRMLYTLVMKEETGSCSGNTKYTIQLYEYTESVPKMINNVMIDCGLAVPNKEEPFDLETKLEITVDPEEINPQDPDTDDYDNDGDDEDENYVELEFSNQGDPSYFDFVCTNERDFFTEVGINVPKARKPNPSKRILPEMRALPASDTCTPSVHWHQEDSVVKMCIKVPVTEYEVKLVAGRVLSFSAEYSNRKYKLQLQLFDLVNKTFTHTAGPFYVNVVLSKLKQAEWPRLVLSTEPTKKIKYNVEKLDVSDDEEKKPSDYLRSKEDVDGDDDGKFYDEIGSDSSDSDFSLSLDSDEN